MSQFCAEELIVHIGGTGQYSLPFDRDFTTFENERREHPAVTQKTRRVWKCCATRTWVVDTQSTEFIPSTVYCYRRYRYNWGWGPCDFLLILRSAIVEKINCSRARPPTPTTAAGRQDAKPTITRRINWTTWTLHRRRTGPTRQRRQNQEPWRQRRDGIEIPPCPCRYLPSKGLFVTSREHHVSFTARTVHLKPCNVGRIPCVQPHPVVGPSDFLLLLRSTFPFYRSTNAQQEGLVVFFELVGRPHSWNNARICGAAFTKLLFEGRTSLSLCSSPWAR